MGKRQRTWARYKRDELILLLGGKCVDCGNEEDLEFDVIVTLGNNNHHKIEWSHRISFYRKQFDLNNLALRCTKCNSKKGNKLMLNPKLLDVPF